MKKALITGVTGQDGSYLAELLLEKGYEVHGAALSGCVLALSDGIGAADDLFGPKSGVRFNPRSVEDMTVKLRTVMQMSDESMEEARAEVLSLARAHGMDLFVRGVEYHAYS